MADPQDWRLRADIADARGLTARLREARHFERELEPLIGTDVVLSADDEKLFAYANTKEAVEETRRALEHQLASEGRCAVICISHWDDDDGEWLQVDPPPGPQELEREHKQEEEHDAELAREARVVTRSVAITSGKMARNWFETTVADEARELGVELSIVEHPHLLRTQIVFTLTGPAGKVEEVIADMQDRAGAATRLETAYLTPI
jgi:hypothetical protein